MTHIPANITLVKKKKKTGQVSVLRDSIVTILLVQIWFIFLAPFTLCR